MSHPILEELRSDEFAIRYEIIATPTALRSALLKAPEIRELKEAIDRGEIKETQLREFVGCLSGDFRPGHHFPHEMALAALAVTMEARMTDFAYEFLRDLSAIQIREMFLSPLVAGLCLKERCRFPFTKTAQMYFDPPGVSLDI
jgi:hypothetical protein